MCDASQIVRFESVVQNDITKHYLRPLGLSWTRGTEIAVPAAHGTWPLETFLTEVPYSLDLALA